MESYNKTLVIIPTVNPTVALIDQVLELVTYNFDVLVVDDGSDLECQVIFDRLRAMAKCRVLKTAKNFGHGISLKMAFNYFLTEYDSASYNGVITTYSDEGYSPQAIYSVAEKLGNKINTIILGTRAFNSKVPEQDIARHNVQNTVFKILDGRKFADTTTGLRAYSRDTVKKLLDVPGVNWEYELNVLQFAVESNIKIEEHKISNAGYVSNLIATMNIKAALEVINVMLKSFYKYSFLAFLAFLLDLFIFRLVITGVMFFFAKNGFLTILCATLIGRIFAGVARLTLTENYYIKHKLTNNKRNKFALLSLIKVCLSAILVSILWYLTKGSEVTIKVFIDVILFLTFYRIEKRTIFNRRK